MTSSTQPQFEEEKSPLPVPTDGLFSPTNLPASPQPPSQVLSQEEDVFAQLNKLVSSCQQSSPIKDSLNTINCQVAELKNQYSEKSNSLAVRSVMLNSLDLEQKIPDLQNSTYKDKRLQSLTEEQTNFQLQQETLKKAVSVVIKAVNALQQGDTTSINTKLKNLSDCARTVEGAPSLGLKLLGRALITLSVVLTFAAALIGLVSLGVASGGLFAPLAVLGGWGVLQVGSGAALTGIFGYSFLRCGRAKGLSRDLSTLHGQLQNQVDEAKVKSEQNEAQLRKELRVISV